MRPVSVYRCQACGFQAGKWYGRCPDCGEFNTIVEERTGVSRGAAGGRRAPSARGAALTAAPIPLAAVSVEGAARIHSGIPELDRVLGGGVVPGSLVLIGGDPGIGKSTLLLQASAALAGTAGPVLYVSGEESAAQVKLRAERLGLAASELLILAETQLETIEAHVAATEPRALIVDSIQTVYLGDLESAPGSVSQVRECGGRLMRLAKGRGTAVFLVGHVTKEGALAGPRVLEHLVDTVLYFEGERHATYRILRAVKNRFGSTNEIGVFEMTDGGLKEVANPSAMFLAERPRGAAGSVIMSTLEGTRPLAPRAPGARHAGPLRDAASHRARRGLQSSVPAAGDPGEARRHPAAEPGRVRERGGRRALPGAGGGPGDRRGVGLELRRAAPGAGRGGAGRGGAHGRGAGHRRARDPPSGGRGAGLCPGGGAAVEPGGRERGTRSRRPA